MQKQCSAKLKLVGNRILREDCHTCALESTFIEEFKEECIRRARDEVTAITKIYEDVYKCFVDRGYNLVENAIPFKSLRSLMYRARHTRLNVSKTMFKTPQQVEIPSTFQDFLLFRDNNIGIIAFATQEGRKILQNSKFCLMDGTFRTCPAPFYQLYSIHVDVGSNESLTATRPVVFILLPNKEKRTYEVMLYLTKQQVPGWNPELVIVDFEVAVISALSNIFPSAVTKGCNFHFKQALSKKSREVGIKSEEENRHVAKCGALAHLPVDFVEDGWLAIMEEAPDTDNITKFNNYFVSTWLDSATFPISLWNCEGQRHRTTNLVESWHKRLNNVSSKKPRLLQFLQTIKDEALYFENYRCTSANRSRQSINRDLKLAVIVKQLQEEKITILQALRMIGKLFKF